MEGFWTLHHQLIDIPKNFHQVGSYRSKYSSTKNGTTDALVAGLHMENEPTEFGTSCCKCCGIHTGIVRVCATNRELADVERLWMKVNKFCILGVDPTYVGLSCWQRTVMTCFSQLTVNIQSCLVHFSYIQGRPMPIFPLSSHMIKMNSSCKKI